VAKKTRQKSPAAKKKIKGGRQAEIRSPAAAVAQVGKPGTGARPVSDKSFREVTDSSREPQPVRLEAPVPTDSKPRKNQAGITPKELEYYRELLLAKRRELVGDMSSMEVEALRAGGGMNLSNLPIHMADIGTDNYEQEFTLGLMEKDRNLMKEINQAMAKIQNGTYGICEGTGKPIGKARLDAQPWARYSIECARKLERRGTK